MYEQEVKENELLHSAVREAYQRNAILQQRIEVLEFENSELSRSIEELERERPGTIYTYEETGMTFSGQLVGVALYNSRLYRWIRWPHSNRIVNETRFRQMASQCIQKELQRRRQRYTKAVNAAEYGADWDKAGVAASAVIERAMEHPPGNYLHRC